MNTDTIGDALPREMARVRDELMPLYREIGNPGLFALGLMQIDLDKAAKALAKGDLIEMIRCYNALKGYST